MVIDLLTRVTRVSIETMKIVEAKALNKLDLVLPIEKLTKLTQFSST